MKPLPSNKIVPNEKIALVERTEIIKSDNETAKFLNNFFSNVIQNRNIPQYHEENPISDSIRDPVMNAVGKYRTHPSIISIKKNCASDTPFIFSFVEKEDIL